jgi:fatty-acyl-CoA synthase
MNNEDIVSDEELIEFIKRLCKVSDSQRLCLYKCPKTSVGKFDKKEIRRLLAKENLLKNIWELE